MTIDEKNLIKGLKKRDEFYLKTFIHGYGGLMKSVIYPYFPNSPEDREEVLNDAILKVWQNIDAYDQAKSEFKNWCAAVAKYRAIDYYRRYHKESFHELFEEAKKNSQWRYAGYKRMASQVWEFPEKEEASTEA